MTCHQINSSAAWCHMYILGHSAFDEGVDKRGRGEGTDETLKRRGS